MALYRQSRAEQVRRLALRMGEWTDDEMITTTYSTAAVPAGMEIADADAVARWSQIFTHRGPSNG